MSTIYDDFGDGFVYAAAFIICATYRRRRRRCRRRRPVCQQNTFDMGFVGSKLILGWFGSRPTAARAVGLPKTFRACRRRRRSRRRRRRPSVVVELECPILELCRRRRCRRRPSDLRLHHQKINCVILDFYPPTPPKSAAGNPLSRTAWPHRHHPSPSSLAVVPLLSRVGGVAAELVRGGVVRWSVVTARWRWRSERKERRKKRVLGARASFWRVGCARLF